jgi:hypothetical protein
LRPRLLPLVATLWAVNAFAQAPVIRQGEMCDPCVPPSVAKSMPVGRTPTQGTALRAEVEQRLRAPFDAAAREGMLTREQARAAGLGHITANFDAIDREGRGAIRFEDYKRFLKERGAALD